MKPTITTMDITPEIARQLLRGNIGNRTVRKAHVTQLARAMKLGRWKFNGDTIRLAGNRLIDGQHRLLAVILSGVTITVLVVSGLDPGVFDTIDGGQRRSPADALSQCGEADARNLVAALAVVDRYTTGRFSFNKAQYTAIDIEEILEKHPDIRRSVRLCSNTKSLIAKRVLAACHYLFSRKDEGAADLFVERLLGGAGIQKGDPVYVLRERLVANLNSKAKLPTEYTMALTIKAWNADRAGRKIYQLRFSESDLFPAVL